MREEHLRQVLAANETIRMPAEPWTLAETAFEPDRCQHWETLFALSNGFIGLRGSHEEDDRKLAKRSYPGTFLNGVYDYRPYHYEWSFPGFPPHGHAIINLCDWSLVRLTVNGDRFSLFSGTVSEYRRELDLRRGLVRRSLVWQSPPGQRVRIESTRLVCMRRRHSAAIRYQVTPLDTGCDILLESLVRPVLPSQVLPGTHLLETARAVEGRVHRLELRTKTAPFHVGAAFLNRLGGAAGPVAEALVDEPGRFGRSFALHVAAGRTVTLDKHAAFHVARETGPAPAEAQATAERADRDGFDRLRAEQEAFWADWWTKADIEIDGNPRDQQAVRFAVFHLRQSTPEDGASSISANALTGDKYCGHVFWDTEMYIAPLFLYTDPALVRPLLQYRHGLLDRARQRAREMGGTGALFAWNSISGEECGIVYEAATAEYHLLCAVAYAISRYVDQTGDADFLFDQGAEILFETARFLGGLGAFIPMRGNRFCLNVVCGPDEYGCGVNNNCYTNVMAQWHFRYAGAVYDRMQRERPEAFAALATRIGLTPAERRHWQDAADRMYIPWNEELGIHAQDDSFLYLNPVDMSQVPLNRDIREDMHPLNLWRIQVAKQADVVLLMFVQSQQFTAAQKRANYEFYEPKTCHGSSLSACIHSIVAGEIGKPREAYAYFEHSAMLDVADFKNNTAGGIHAACLGGTWMAVVNGFAGMRDEPAGLRLAPRLPDAWQAYRFKLNYRGRVIAVDVAREGATYRLLSGAAVEFASGDARIKLSPGQPVARTPLA